MVSEEHIAQLLEKFKKYKPTLFSEALANKVPESRVLIVDTIGQLAFIYKYATVAYIGGGFGAGIHNILEAAAYGLPVIFGPNYMKFNEAVELIGLGAAFSVQNADECLEVFDSLLGNKEESAELGRVSKEYVKENGGATEKIIAKTREYISNY